MVCSTWRKEVQIPFFWQDTQTSLSTLQIALDTMGFFSTWCTKGWCWKDLEMCFSFGYSNTNFNHHLLKRSKKSYSFEMSQSVSCFAVSFVCLWTLLWQIYPIRTCILSPVKVSVWKAVAHVTLLFSLDTDPARDPRDLKGTWKGHDIMRTPIWDVSDVCVVLANNTLRSVEAMPI